MLTLRDQVTLLVGGGFDPKGNPLPETEVGPFPARVDPIGSDEPIRQGQPPLKASFRMIIGPEAGRLIEPTGAVIWHDKQLWVEGIAEPYTSGVGVDHYEVTLQQ